MTYTLHKYFLSCVNSYKIFTLLRSFFFFLYVFGTFRSTSSVLFQQFIHPNVQLHQDIPTTTFATSAFYTFWNNQLFLCLFSYWKLMELSSTTLINLYYSSFFKLFVLILASFCFYLVDLSFLLLFLSLSFSALLLISTLFVLCSNSYCCFCILSCFELFCVSVIFSVFQLNSPFYDYFSIFLLNSANETFLFPCATFIYFSYF